jgi:rubrerythrin
MLLMKPELFAKLNTPEGLQEAVQTAVELEHATIPPYLYALFSLQQGANTEISELITSIVNQEMAHMAYACNILNAIGGAPKINSPECVPKYPGPLPGTVESGLEVHLARFSIAQVEDTFMVIEEPEEPIVIPDLLTDESKLTIGVFYNEIKKQIEEAGEKIFTHRENLQVEGYLGVTAVNSVETACTAIETIVDQGEGTSTSPLESPGAEPAHYYRFAEIARGKKLIEAKGETPPWRYAGEAIPFEATKVYPAISDPRASVYPSGSTARKECDAFNAIYTELLDLLHEGFNGKPERVGEAIGSMFKLQAQAIKLMGIELKPGENAGPSFEYTS